MLSRLVAFSGLVAASNLLPQFEIPPLAAQIKDQIEQVQLGPVFAERYACVEHALELAYAGDALGVDCQIVSSVEIGRDGFFRLYRSDGKANADWYGWHANVLAPFDGTVIYAFERPDQNTPGVLGSGPAGTLRIQNAAGVVVNYGHVTEITVEVGQYVKSGEAIAKVGNNGSSRAPHIHIGAYRKDDAVPLQIRWNLPAIAKARAQAGVR